MRQKHGAVIVKGGRVIGIGINTYRNEPALSGAPANALSYHAEAMAIRSVNPDINLKTATLYVARISLGGNVSLSRPCDACANLIWDSGIRKVVHT